MKQQISFSSALTALILLLCLQVSNGQVAPKKILSPAPERMDFIRTLQSDGSVSCIEVKRDAAHIAREAESRQPVQYFVVPQTIGRRKGNNGQATQGADIVLQATAQLLANTTALNAFVAAAARWEAVLTTPVTFTIKADYGDSAFGEPFPNANILAAASTPFLQGFGTFADFAEILKAQNATDDSLLYNAVPAALPSTLTSGTTLITPLMGLPNILALDVGVTEAGFPASIPSIGFNSAFSFDFDPSDGITAGQIDFDGVAAHEIGHTLGFVSFVGTAGGTTATTRIGTAWDMFRFRPGVVTNLTQFTAAPRVITAGPTQIPEAGTPSNQVFWDGIGERQLSTGDANAANGDGRQASHWRADELSGATIGIMDPTLAPGVRASIQDADLRLLQLSGWQVDFTPLSITQTDNATPQSFALGQNYPNPFNPSTTIKYQLASAGTVSLKVFDVLGREVETLVQAKQSAGTYQAAFNAAKLSSGIYFYQLRTGSFSETKKMMLVK